MVLIDGEGNELPTAFKNSNEKPKTRPVKEILEDLISKQKNGCHNLRLERTKLLINSDALANSEQEKFLRDLVWTCFDGEYEDDLAVIMFNSFRG